MSTRLIVACAIAALTFAAGPRAFAADLYGENDYVPRDDGSTYTDADRYPPPAGAYDDHPQNDSDDPADDDRYSGHDNRYDRGPHEEYPGSTKDSYAAPVYPPRYAERYGGPEGRCLPHWRIQHRLHNDGWVDLRPIERSRDTALVRARRAESGRVFTLRIDGCSGEVVDARPYFLRTFGANAPRPWRRGYAY